MQPKLRDTYLQNSLDTKQEGSDAKHRVNTCSSSALSSKTPNNDSTSEIDKTPGKTYRTSTTTSTSACASHVVPSYRFKLHNPTRQLRSATKIEKEVTNTKSPSTHWDWKHPNTEDQDKPENRTTKKWIIDTEECKKKCQCNDHVHSWCCKGLGVCTGKCTTKSTTAKHANKPETEKQTDRHLTTMDTSPSATSQPTLKHHKLSSCNASQADKPKACWLKHFRTVVCAVCCHDFRLPVLRLFHAGLRL